MYWTLVDKTGVPLTHHVTSERITRPSTEVAVFMQRTPSTIRCYLRKPKEPWALGGLLAPHPPQPLLRTPVERWLAQVHSAQHRSLCYPYNVHYTKILLLQFTLKSKRSWVCLHLELFNSLGRSSFLEVLTSHWIQTEFTRYFFIIYF